MKNNNRTHAGNPCSRANAGTERNKKKEIPKPVIFSNQELELMTIEELNINMECITLYIKLLGGTRELVDAIVRTSLMSAVKSAEAFVEYVKSK